ncbi:hypothetical protein IJG04_02610 [Candidatus Saccharibacteria bacterium]|nr:hypothetical protein [Candidatus Saccharibacteria bacterium]
MPAGKTLGDNSNDSAASNLVALVEYLSQMEQRQPAYPQWAKFDTAATMSDNNGGVIKF